jgi:hypothetical protein
MYHGCRLHIPARKLLGVRWGSLLGGLFQTSLGIQFCQHGVALEVLIDAGSNRLDGWVGAQNVRTRRVVRHDLAQGIHGSGGIAGGRGGRKGVQQILQLGAVLGRQAAAEQVDQPGDIRGGKVLEKDSDRIGQGIGRYGRAWRDARQSWRGATCHTRQACAR